MKHPTLKQLQERFGYFEWRPKKEGYIEVLTRDWLKNIVEVDLPVVGLTRCHKEVMYSLFRIFTRILESGLAHKIDKEDYQKWGGCWVPRCVKWDCSLGISCHSFGVAIDINVSWNAYGTKGTQDKRIIKIFEDEGWLWGGTWKVPDPMHFEVGYPWRFKELKPVILLKK